MLRVFGILIFVRVMWWFIVLVASLGAALWASIASYLRVRRQLKEHPPKEIKE
jgi:ABC-type uncharacterized transport system permease subunit